MSTPHAYYEPEVFARGILREYLHRVQTDGASVCVTFDDGLGYARCRWGRATYDTPAITLAFPAHLIGASVDDLEAAARAALEHVPLPH